LGTLRGGRWAAGHHYRVIGKNRLGDKGEKKPTRLSQKLILKKGRERELNAKKDEARSRRMGRIDRSLKGGQNCFPWGKGVAGKRINKADKEEVGYS